MANRKKVEQYIRTNDNHVVINKLKRNLSLTPTDLAALESMLFSAEEIESRASLSRSTIGISA